jgi:hypothetical protein
MSAHRAGAFGLYSASLCAFFRSLGISPNPGDDRRCRTRSAW